MNPIIGISLKDISLTYDVFYDKSRTLKELVLNSIHRRKYVEKRKDKIKAIDSVSLDIRHGERIGIIGHNGAGKSSLLKVISGILKPTQGTVEVHGSIQPLIEMAAGFNPEFSGRENIYLNGYMLGFRREQIQANEQDIIEFADLQEFIDVPVKYYSSGMQVRLAFTIATSIDPEYLIFDELLSAGDANFMEKARRRINKLIEKAKVLVVVSHDLSTITAFCNRTLVMDKGKVVFDGKPEEAIAYYLKHAVRTREDLRAEPLEIAQPRWRKPTDDSVVISCKLDSPIAVEGTVTLSIGNPETSTRLKTSQAFAMSGQKSLQLEIAVEPKSSLAGDFEARLDFEYGLPGGVRVKAERKCRFSLGNEREGALEAAWQFSEVPNSFQI